MRVWALVLALAGCDRVFGIGDPYEDADHTTNGSDAASDTGSATPDAAATPVLLGHWAFENDLTNAADGGQGTCTGCTYVTGKHGLAVHLDGSACIHTVLLQPASPATFTIMMWVNPATATPMTILSRQTSATSGDFPWLLDGDGVNITATMWQGSANATAMGPGFTGGSWVHVAETFDGAQLVLYDGSSSAGTTTTEPVVYGTHPDLFFGCKENGVASAFTGDIDDVYIFAGALDSGMIAQYAGA